MSYSKNYICKFMQANSWHHKLFHFHLSFWIWKVWKGRGKITKIWISQEWKELFRWNKKFFWPISSQCSLHGLKFSSHTMFVLANMDNSMGNIRFLNSWNMHVCISGCKQLYFAIDLLTFAKAKTFRMVWWF